MKTREFEIRKVGRSDLAEVRRLEEYCFLGMMGYDAEGADLVLGHSPMMDNCYGVYSGRELVSMLTVFPFRMRYRGEWVPMGGVSSVATMPENRCRGYVRALIKDALERMREDGVLFSVLSPFRYAFYKKYGWGWTFSHKEIKLDIKDLKKFGDGSCSFRPLGLSDYDAMGRLYEDAVAGLNGPLQREDWAYREMWRKKEENYWYGAFNGKGELTGYLMYKKDGEKRELQVFDMCAADRSARHELFRFLYLHEAQARHVLLQNLPDKDPFLFETDNPRRGITMHPGMMSRIVDVEGWLKRYAHSVPGELRLKITDSMAGWNDALFSIRQGSGTAVVERLEPAERADAVCDISVFSQLAMGYLPVAVAQDTAALRVVHPDSEGVLEALFPAASTWLNEFF